jgi:1,4-dihydroxy-2-naphthoyl-CoA synthase
MEVMMQSMLKTTEDAKEGPRAFAEKRKANFRGE